MPVLDEVKDVLAACCASTKVLSKTIFPERFYLPFAKMHDGIFEAIDDDRYQKVVIKAPRGLGKTSLANLAYPAKKILFREKKYIVQISNTSTQAVMQAENLKQELLKNEIIVKLFGSIKSENFSKEQWVTSSGTMVMPRGSGQQVRGLLFGNSRPDLIICDDLEDDEGVESEEQRKKLKQWFFADVLNSISRHRSDWKIVYIGTLLHEDSLLATLMELKDWKKVELSLFDDNYKSNWPDFMTDQAIWDMVEGYREAGELDVLYREYKGEAISKEDAIFRPSYFRYYEESEINPRQLESIVILDPAKTVKIHSAESALICWGIDTVGNKLYVRDLVAKKMHPDELYDELFEMCKRMRASVIGIETTSLHDWIMYPLTNEMLRRGLNFEIVEINAVGKKPERAKWLVPLYRRGLVYHNKRVCGPLEAQMLSFPRNKRWDCIDAAAYIVKMLAEGQRYFLSTLDTKTGDSPVADYVEADIEGEEPLPEDDDLDIAGDMILRTGSWRTV
uniref:Putative terminase n=2 Tax=viral metagenome TaxID=1070528 RepID=A0A6M3LIC2_9ZZZZ